MELSGGGRLAFAKWRWRNKWWRENLDPSIHCTMHTGEIQFKLQITNTVQIQIQTSELNWAAFIYHLQLYSSHYITLYCIPYAAQFPVSTAHGTRQLATCEPGFFYLQCRFCILSAFHFIHKCIVFCILYMVKKREEINVMTKFLYCVFIYSPQGLSDYSSWSWSPRQILGFLGHI